MADRYSNYRQFNDDELIDRLRRGEAAIMDFICDKYKNLVRSKAKSMFILGAVYKPPDVHGGAGLPKAETFSAEYLCAAIWRRFR